MLRGYLMFGAVLAAALILLFLFPERREAAVTTAGKYLLEMILIPILPAVMVLMGLFVERLIEWTDQRPRTAERPGKENTR